jgi:hypothetical protein
VLTITCSAALATVRNGGFAFVASELARARLRSGPKKLTVIADFCECYALKREQAPRHTTRFRVLHKTDSDLRKADIA